MGSNLTSAWSFPKPTRLGPFGVMVACGAAAGAALLAEFVLRLSSAAPSVSLMLDGFALAALSIAGYAAYRTAAGIGELKRTAFVNAGYRLFVDRSSEGYFRTDAAGRFIEVNRALAQICGFVTPSAFCQALNKDPMQLYFDRGSRTEFASQMHAQGSVNNFISKIRRRDGKAIWINENARAVYNRAGKFLFYEGTLRDITVEREALQAARQALKDSQDAARAKSAFIAATNHELKTPLNAIIGFSEVMLHQLLGPIQEGYRSYVEHIHNSGKRLLGAINDVLDFARIEGGALALDESVVALDRIMEQALSSVTEIRSDPPPVKLLIAPGLPLIRADEKRILQVVINLLSNAVKFTPATGEIHVRAGEGPDGSILVEIADTGIGMEPARVAVALEPFKQIDGRLARQFEGLGLGLPLAKGLVDLHNGHIAIASAPGKGTTVNLSFPPERTVRPSELESQPRMRAAL